MLLLRAELWATSAAGAADLAVDLGFRMSGWPVAFWALAAILELIGEGLGWLREGPAGAPGLGSEAPSLAHSCSYSPFLTLSGGSRSGLV